MLTDKKPYDFDRVFRIIVALVTAALLLWLVYATRQVLIPLAIAFLLAYLLNPIVDFVQRRIRNRAAAVFTTVFGVLVLLLLLAVLIVPMLAREVVGTGQTLKHMVDENSPLAQWADAHMPANLSQQVDQFIHSDDFRRFLQSEQFDRVMESAQSASGVLLQLVRWTFAQVWGIVSGVYAIVLGITGLFLILLYMIFLLIDYKLLTASWKDYLPPKHRDGIVAFLNEFNAAMATYFRGQFLVAASVGILFAVGFQIIGLKLGIMLGLFIGALNMVPYLQTIGIIPAVLLAVLTAVDKSGSVLWHLVGVAAVFIIVQTLQDTVLTPRIMGKVTGLRPVVILFSVLFWGKLLGFLGLIIAIPLTCLGVAYYRRLLARQEKAESKIVEASEAADTQA